MNTEDFVTYEQAVKLKECGFDWPCTTYLNPKSYGDKVAIAWREITIKECSSPEVLCPSLSQAAKWLRDKHSLHVQIESVIGKRWTYTLVDTAPQSDMEGEYYDRIPDRDSYPIFDTYESALSAGIDAALELIKENTLCQK